MEPLGRWREPHPYIVAPCRVQWTAPARRGVQTWVGQVGDRPVARIKRQPGHLGSACTALVDGWVWNLSGAANPMGLHESIAREFPSLQAAKRAVEDALRCHPVQPIKMVDEDEG